jgi:hypothetical protein
VMNSLDFCSRSYDCLSFHCDIIKADRHTLPNKTTKALWINVLLFSQFQES